MPKPATGELTKTAEGFVARITLKGRERESYLLAACRNETEADERRQLLASLAARFRKANVIHTREARELLKTIASCAPALLPAATQVATELAGGVVVPGARSEAPTFRELAKDWTDGKLTERYPDHVKKKDTADLDAARLGELCKIDVGGILLGDIPLDRFSIDHAEEAMRRLPARAKRPATRRQYAQLINRTLALAVYPCRILKASPLPRGFMPRVGKAPGFAYLYPSEDAALLAHTPIPLGRRVLWAFLDREGCRSGEAVAMRIGFDVDLERGVVRLDKNKTDEPRAWVLDPNVAAALRAYVKLRNAKRGDALFVDEDGEPFDHSKFAERLRADLGAAGLDRPELFASGENTRQLRAHDLRGTFVTLSLANGRSETWCKDRTGHTTSDMLNRYRRAARSASELGLGPLHPMDLAIPELTDYPGITQAGENGPSDSEHNLPISLLKAEVAEPADAADSKSVSRKGV